VRLDIRIKEDLAEEIGRIIGYDTLTPTLPKRETRGILHKRAHYENKIRAILLARGFSEVITYTFGDTGEVSLVKGLADDKEKLRAELGKGLIEAYTRNLYNAPLLGEKVIKIFEFGNIFTQAGEVRHMALICDDGAKKSSFKEEVEIIMEEIKQVLAVQSIDYKVLSNKPYGIECNIDALIATLEAPRSYEASLSTTRISSYKPVSPYPFIVRDIAVWTPFGTSWEDIHALALQVNDSRIARIDCFDTFTKEVDGVKKTSYAFRFVIQSYEKTLTDEEANEIANTVYSLLREKGYEIR
jgi:phenylalanyl-tRNA synthetase beta chain